ncbi:MAG: cyclic nucleotide-binding domain-containing protein [Anaerolineales bacterium]|jgi:uncharacterized membrane protein YdbT with pleckstrin-like domain
MSPEEVIEFLKNVLVFRNLDEGHLSRLATKFDDQSLRSSEHLFSEGEPSRAFYIIVTGKIHLSRGDGKRKKDIGTLNSVDFFGEEALMANRSRSATAIAVEDTRLLVLNKGDFKWMLSEYPEVKKGLKRLAASYRLARRKHLNWLGTDEVVHMIARKHFLLLFPALLPSTILGFLSAWLFFSGMGLGAGPIATLMEFSAALIAMAALLWGVWKWIDWGNDYYIVTDQRVVWLEQILLLYDSRQEAPLSTILSVNVSTNQIQRIFGYGDVIVRTYTGSIVMRNVDHPNQFATMVEEYWHRALERKEEEELELAAQVIRERLGFEQRQQVLQEEPIPTQPMPVQPPPDDGKGTKPSIIERIFGNFLKMRYEEGNTVTYRKHWFVLISRLATPALILFFLVIYAFARVFGLIGFPALGTTFKVLGAFILVTLPWWLYEYVDWRNDIYQVTDKHIFDIERKPLGREVKKSAPLENILSLDYQRENILQRVLNYGTVAINVGEARFDFMGVHNPAGVQQEVFDRFNARRAQIEMDEASRQRERVVQYLEIYHDQITNNKDEQG